MRQGRVESSWPIIRGQGFFSGKAPIQRPQRDSNPALLRPSGVPSSCGRGASIQQEQGQRPGTLPQTWRLRRLELSDEADPGRVGDADPSLESRRIHGSLSGLFRLLHSAPYRPGPPALLELALLGHILREAYGGGDLVGLVARGGRQEDREAKGGREMLALLGLGLLVIGILVVLIGTGSPLRPRKSDPPAAPPEPAPVPLALRSCLWRRSIACRRRRLKPELVSAHGIRARL